MSELEDLKKENESLKLKILELEFAVKLARFMADTRAGTINKMVQEKIVEVREIISERDLVKKMLERIKMDNEKYEDLRDYLLKSFPHILKSPEKIDKNLEKNKIETKRDDGIDLSQTYVGENGQVYAPQHIIDVTMVVIEKLKKQIEDILGTDYIGEDDENLT